eukprot:m.353088 g.353088  ORF g.353088 m.353088 type:complete len:607 (-) comp16680_c0_seq1:195-2015(-)
MASQEPTEHLRRLSQQFRPSEELGFADQSIEAIKGWMKDNPESAAIALRELAKAQQFSSALLDLNAALLNCTDADEVISQIMSHAADLIQCERCSVFTYDHEHQVLESRVFNVSEDGVTKAAEEPIRFPATVGIAGACAMQGEIQVVPDAYSDERFNKSVDLQTGFKTRNILCLPVVNSHNEVIAVAQLINKKDNGNFSKGDTSAAKVIAAYCGLALHNAHLYEQARRDARRRQVVLEMISYHTRAHPKEVEALNKQPVREDFLPLINSITFDPLSIDEDDSLIACRMMFVQSGLAAKFRIPHQKLCAWLICTKRSYRDVRYHNWRHAFNVGQFVYGLSTCSSVSAHFTDLEKLGLLVAALSHDLDHRGTNNAFEKKYETALGDLYSTSTLEHHHFDRAVTILNTEGHNILSELPAKQYDYLVNFIENAILATDLTSHFRDRKQYQTLVESNTFSFDNKEHMELLRSIVMTASDLGAVTKPFPAQQRVAELVYSEFFEQGDLEKALGTSSEELQDLMNRQKLAELPKMQLGFMDFVASPVYKTLGVHFPDLAVLPTLVQQNYDAWKALMERGPYTYITPVHVLTAKTKADIVNDLVKEARSRVEAV